MSTIQLPALYRIETFPAGAARARTRQDAPHEHPPAQSFARGKAVKEADFLVQLMVSGDADLRRSLGRQEAAQAREAAYAFAVAHKASGSARSIGSQQAIA